MNYRLVLLMNSNDPTVTSALRFFAWDVTLIATGGAAQYFSPAEEFIIRRSRLVFSLLILVLVVELRLPRKTQVCPNKSIGF